MLEGFYFLATSWFLSAVSLSIAQGKTAADEAILTNAGLKTDNATLLAFFNKRTLHDADREIVAKLIRQLGSATYRTREQALAELIARGPVVVGMLRAALQDNDLEIVRRVEKCLAQDSGKRRGSGSAARRSARPCGAPGCWWA